MQTNKFKVGDTVVHAEDNDEWKVVSYRDHKYLLLENEDGNILVTKAENFKLKEEQMEKTIFEAGQTVWCTCMGKGVVTEVNLYGKAVKVKHENRRNILQYYFDGRLFEEGNRTLFFSKPEVIADCEPPYVGKLVGKKVYFTDTGGVARLVDVYEETKKSFITTTGLTYNKAQIKTLVVLDNVPAYTPD